MEKQDDITDITAVQEFSGGRCVPYLFMWLYIYIRYEYIDRVQSSNVHITNVNSN